MIVSALIKTLANLILGSMIFDRVMAAVKRWADEKISGAEKKAGVLNELEIIGLELLEWEANLAIELAVAYLKKV